MYQRALQLQSNIAQKSHFLFGARQTGKSTLLRTLFPESFYVNLLEANTFRLLSSNPESLRQSLKPNEKIVVIDEVQKLPSILDEVHLLIERNKMLRFVLTGSSARKLRRRGVNLLAGRAWTEYLFPLTTQEVGIDRLHDLLLIGGLPAVLDSSDPQRELREYVGVYLQEEIRAEALTRSIEAFSRFLTVAGLANGQQLNFTKIGNDAQVPPRTVREFFSVLEDTLIGYQLRPVGTSRKRKSVATSKFFFFDLGVAHCLQGISSLAIGTHQYGVALEHLIANELRAALHYQGVHQPLQYWRSLSQLEVDFVIGDILAVEVKSAGRVSEQDAKGLRALQEEIRFKRRIIVSLEQTARRLDDGIEVLPLKEFLGKIWCGELFS
jgi:predicted AAA+ superfamily ATPase